MDRPGESAEATSFFHTQSPAPMDPICMVNLIETCTLIDQSNTACGLPGNPACARKRSSKADSDEEVIRVEEEGKPAECHE
jgi:hypothetical protein